MIYDWLNNPLLCWLLKILSVFFFALLALYANGKYDIEALNGALATIKESRKPAQRRIQEVGAALATEDEQRHKLEVITATLATLKERLENANGNI